MSSENLKVTWGLIVSLKNGRRICIEIEVEATRLGGKVLKWLWCVTEHKGAGATPMESL